MLSVYHALYFEFETMSFYIYMIYAPCSCAIKLCRSICQLLKLYHIYILLVQCLIFNYIIFIYTGSKYLWPVRFDRSEIIEPAVQPVLNGWTNEPLIRRLRRFDFRSGSNNYGRVPFPCEVMIRGCFTPPPVSRD